MPRHHATPGSRRGAPELPATVLDLRDYPRLTTSTPPLTGRPWYLQTRRRFPHGEQARTGGPFTSYLDEGLWEPLIHNWATVISRHATTLHPFIWAVQGATLVGAWGGEPQISNREVISCQILSRVLQNTPAIYL